MKYWACNHPIFLNNRQGPRRVQPDPGMLPAHLRCWPRLWQARFRPLTIQLPERFRIRPESCPPLYHIKSCPHFLQLLPRWHYSDPGNAAGYSRIHSWDNHRWIVAFGPHLGGIGRNFAPIQGEWGRGHGRNGQKRSSWQGLIKHRHLLFNRFGSRFVNQPYWLAVNISIKTSLDMEKAMKCEVGGQPVYRGDERMVSRFSRKNKILKLKSSLFFLIIKETIA